jgi:hypothetical protein
MQPIAIPPNDNEKKLIVTDNIDVFAPLIMFEDIIIKIIQVASLRSDSPSIKEENFFGAPTSFNKAITAAVSVQDIILPNKNALINV